jgi:hypothetical protein
MNSPLRSHLTCDSAVIVLDAFGPDDHSKVPFCLAIYMGKIGYHLSDLTREQSRRTRRYKAGGPWAFMLSIHVIEETGHPYLHCGHEYGSEP